MLFSLILQAAAKFPAFFYLCCCFHLPGSFLQEQAGFKETAVFAREAGVLAQGGRWAPPAGRMKRLVPTEGQCCGPRQLPYLCVSGALGTGTLRLWDSKSPVAVFQERTSWEVWEVVSWGLETSPFPCILSRWCVDLWP